MKRIFLSLTLLLGFSYIVEAIDYKAIAIGTDFSFTEGKGTSRICGFDSQAIRCWNAQPSGVTILPWK
ncbi:MAG: hypothetical protein AB7F59_08535 [Bdellovibrionales bacterium]